MPEEVRRLFNALQRAVDDLANARVLVDNALRQVEDQIQAFRVRIVRRKAPVVRASPQRPCDTKLVPRGTTRLEQ